jgi:hypothetical protein
MHMPLLIATTAGQTITSGAAMTQHQGNAMDAPHALQSSTEHNVGVLLRALALRVHLPYVQQVPGGKRGARGLQTENVTPVPYAQQ